MKLKYSRRPYKEFYAAWVNYQAKIDPKRAVGGMWEEIGKLQFGFLLKNGLMPNHKLLDLGCGSLRGGIYFIRYLDRGNYFGMDISEEILKAAKKILRENFLEDKNPTLIHNTDLSFKELQGKKFDYIIAQSVFTHMPLCDIKECFQNVGRILKKDGVFFATFYESLAIKTTTRGLAFHYPLKILTKLANEYNLKIEKLENYVHPRGQKMLKISKRKK
ncbi:MAG: class I SAM-dependent methyltransferase [Candidatus Bathyarchaeia archaeon]